MFQSLNAPTPFKCGDLPSTDQNILILEHPRVAHSVAERGICFDEVHHPLNLSPGQGNVIALISL